MDTSKKVNANAGKGERYRPGEVSQNFGEPNLVAPGAGISMSARVPTQGHSRGSASGQSRSDLSQKTSRKGAPGPSIGNAGPHPAGVAGASESVAGRGVTRTLSMPGDDQPGRRGGPGGGTPSERYRKKY